MATGFSSAELAFNSSVFRMNEENRWKFLEEMKPGMGLLMDSPIPILTLTTTYVLFVCLIGPAIMKNREPFQLKTVIRFYNLLMVFVAALLFVRIYSAIGSFSNMLDCKKTFNLEDQCGSTVYKMGNFILFVRLSEYMDTIFFTLRKKQNQVTFLHVFHHAFVPIYAYWIIRTAPLRFNNYIIIINSLIHVLMYFYYFLATFQERQQVAKDEGKSHKRQSFAMKVVTKLLMFKKYMTQLQILQFVSLAAYAIWAAVQPNHCNVPWTYITANLFLALGFLGLFLHFYIKSYKAYNAASNAKRK